MLLILLACTPASPTDTGAAPGEEAPLPDVWGPPPAGDLDPEPGVVEVHLTASRSEVSWVDDGPTSVWAYNGVVPGPLIQARLGDTVRVVFENDLDEATTIHWHGLRIDDEMDGVPAVQDPVEPGEQFVYEFTPPDAGSYWYHPHMRSYEQIERGLQGTLIVHEPDAPAVDRDRYFVIDDVALTGKGSIQRFSMSGMDQMMGRYGNTLLVNGSTDLLTDEVRPGGVERWRIVNTANARTMWVDVTGARWRVIAIDGTLLPEPYETERFQVPVGRRVDLEVIPDLDAEAVGLRVALPDGSDWSEYPVFEGTPAGDAGPGEWAQWPAAPLPDLLDTEQELILLLNAESDGSDLSWTINGETYTEGEGFEVQAHVPTRIIIKERTGMEHPFHLHGQFFQVIARNEEVDPTDLGQLDTVLVNGNDRVDLYTTFDNPGVWMAHCHILEHAELGMMTEMHVTE